MRLLLLVCSCAALPPTPARCVKAASGAARLKVGDWGCFGGKDRELWLVWDRTGSSIRFDDGRQVALGAERRREILRSLVDAVRREEAPSESDSTSTISAQLDWSCGGVPQSLYFRTRDLYEWTYFRSKGMSGARWKRYHRALGLELIARQLIRR